MDTYRERKMIVEFGEGKVGVMRTAEQGEDFDSGLAFVNQEAHSIGEVVPGRIGRTTDEVDCFLRFHFSNSQSVQVLIDDLIILRDSIAGGRTLLAPDAGYSAASSGIVNASADSTSQAESAPTQRG